MMQFLLALLLPLSFALSATAQSSDCKCTPDSSCWPSDSEWAALNSTLEGILIRGVPPGSVCYSNQPNYDEAQCQVAISEWSNSTWHAQNPISIDYPLWVNNSCNPIFPNGTSFDGDPNAGARGCTIGNYPAYAVAATQPEHIGTALKWAVEKNIRVVVKNTGHNYQGRSTGFGSLSIWTHYFRGVEYINDFQPASCPTNETLMAVRVGAGEIGTDVQHKIAENGAVIVTGGNPDTGLLGWLVAGGHGLLSNEHGLGADNLLEATMVTPNGTILTANPCQNPDLFFATRGGGGSTFGVITSAVVRAYPTPQTTAYSFNITTLDPNATTQFWDLMAFIHTELPRLKEGGMAGYYTIAGPPYIDFLGMEWVFYLFNKPNGTAEALMQPILDRVNNQSAIFKPGISIASYPTYIDATGSINSESVGSSVGAYGSRLLTAESIADRERFAGILGQIGPHVDPNDPNGPQGNSLILGHLVAPPPSPPSYAPSLISVTPAWRRTTTHIIVQENWPVGIPQSEIDAVYEDIHTQKIQPLRELAPDTGAYFNECDSLEENWQEAFWGENYEALTVIKKSVDPEGALYCRLCVGSEEWTESESGALCRVA